jgi:hypothetical protein
MRKPAFLALLALIVTIAAAPSWQRVLLTQPAYDSETLDYGLPPASEIRTGDYDARRVRRWVLIDVPGGDVKFSPPGAGLGTGFNDRVRMKLVADLADLTGGNKGKPIVFFCFHGNRRLPPNAAMRDFRLFA